MGQAFLMGQSGGGVKAENIATKWLSGSCVLTGVNADQQGCKFGNNLLLQAATSKDAIVGFEIASSSGTNYMVKNNRSPNAEYVRLDFNGTKSWLSGHYMAFRCLLRLRLNGTSKIDVLDPNGNLLLSSVTDLEFQFGYYDGAPSNCTKMDMHLFDNYLGK